MIDFKKLLIKFAAELKFELSMRRKVWRVIPGTKHKFGDSKKQSRYDNMRLMEKVFREMTEYELEKIVSRIQRKKKESETPSQTSLNL